MKCTIRSIVLMCCVLPLMSLSLIQTTQADQLPFSLQTTPGQLPKNVVPIDYNLTINTNVENLTFSGFEQVKIRIVSPIRTITVNQNGLCIQGVKLSETNDAPTVALNPKAETATFTFPTTINPGTRTISVSFSGKITATPSGIFYLKYPDNGVQKILIATMFESSDARRMFLCWESASFDVFQLMSYFHDDVHADQFVTFAKNEISPDLSQQTTATIEQIRIDAAFANRNLANVDAWVAQKLRRTASGQN